MKQKIQQKMKGFGHHGEHAAPFKMFESCISTALENNRQVSSFVILEI